MEVVPNRLRPAHSRIDRRVVDEEDAPRGLGNADFAGNELTWRNATRAFAHVLPACPTWFGRAFSLGHSVRRAKDKDHSIQVLSDVQRKRSQRQNREPWVLVGMGACGQHLTGGSKSNQKEHAGFDAYVRNRAGRPVQDADKW